MLVRAPRENSVVWQLERRCTEIAIQIPPCPLLNYLQKPIHNVDFALHSSVEQLNRGRFKH